MKIPVPKIAFPDAVLRGIGQIMLQENRWTGLFFLTGLFMGSWQGGVAALLAATTGTITAALLKYPRKETEAGIYGFSAALVGVGLAFLFKATALIWVLISVGSVLATILQHFFVRRAIPVFTLPFILVTWIMVFLLRRYTDIPASHLFLKTFEPTDYHYFVAITNGFGEVIFQEGLWAGVLFFLGVYVHNPIAALYGLAASLLGAALSFLNGQALEQVQMGLFGFNTVLTALVFAGPRKSDGLWVLMGTLITIAIHNAMVSVHFLTTAGGVFTFPFVVGTWLTLLLQKGLATVRRK